MSSNTTHPALDDPNVFILYRYNPSLPAAVIFIILFIITTCFHLWQTIRSRAWYTIPLSVGGIFEIIGYIGRALSARNQWELGPYVIQAVLLLVAPALFAATVYMILGRIILLVDGEKYSIIRRRWLTKIFVFGDIVGFITQACGASIMTGKNNNAIKVGEDIIIVGLFVQIVSFAIFLIVSFIFHSRILKHPTALSRPDSGIKWKKHLYVLYTTSMLIFVRSIFRAIEYIMGNDGFILRHEVFLYIFDSVLMLVVMVIFNVFHPSEITKSLKHYSAPVPLIENSRASKV